MPDPNRQPIVIATWPFGMPASEVAWKILEPGGAAMDAVEAGVTQCEDDPSVNTVGYGGLPDADGEVTLDACVMDHEGRCGSVAGMKRIKNPAKVARLVMETTPHVMLVGDGATRFAVKQGFSETNLLTPESAKAYEQWKQKQQKGETHDTIGMVALDPHGRMAGACSTSGLSFKLPGRVGDSPIIGAGLYVLGGVGGAAATGVGEEVIKICGSFAIVENLRRGMGAKEAIADVLERLRRRRGNAHTDVSFVALRADGEAAGLSLRKQTNFRYAVISPAGKNLITAEALVE